MTVRTPPGWPACLGATLLAPTLFGLLLDLPATTGDERVFRVRVLLGLLVFAAAVYFAAVRLILRYMWPRSMMRIVLGVAIVLRVLLLTAPPVLSADIYRYVWDGRVQAAGINPYRYVPADPALAALRDPTVDPRINRADYARTIYPPLAEAVFAAVAQVSDSVMAMHLTMLAFETGGIICLLRLLPLAGMPGERILIYVWNPLALWSFANDGHVDAIAVGLPGLALLLRVRPNDGWAGAALAGAVLAKFFPLVVAPAFLRGGHFWRPFLAGVALIGGGYTLYSGVGLHVLGFLPSYGHEEGLVNGTGLWALAGLAKLAVLPPNAPLIYATIVATALLALSVGILWQRRPANDALTLCRDTGMLAAAAMAVTSPHYHWYFAC